ncbi:ankyrin repeat-containing domain protein [Mycena vulgaris]|nr:ankyrin repeat-containing domain protein [Mycena vulgaris]
MTDRRKELVKNWIRAKLHREQKAPNPTEQTPISPVGVGAPSTSDPPNDHALSRTAESVVDNIPLVLELVAQIANIAAKVPFIAPIAALTTGILKAYREAKDMDEKRNVLFTHITNLSGDLSATVLRMEATNHVDLIGRLRVDMEAYAGLLKRTSAFIEEYDNQSAAIRFAARTQLATKLTALSQELEVFGARFRTNRLIDLTLHERTNAAILENVHQMALEEKLEKWLKAPDMKIKQLETQRLRREGTGLWLLDGARFIEWQDHPGCLWIMGPSGAGKSVLSSAVISKLVAEKQPFGLEQTPPVAFFYFDFKDKEGQAVESALRRIVLQLSAQSPNPYKVLDKQYMVSKGQTLPTYQDLQAVLETLLLELGRAYIVLDALDECKITDQRQLFDFISVLRGWTATPLHLLITSQPRQIFTEQFEGVPCIELDAGVTEHDLRLFVSNEMCISDIWAPHAEDVTERVVRKSSGMFRLAACLLVELFRCPYQDELEETLDNLPDDLFGIYDRFLQTIRPKDFIYVEAVLRWLLFSGAPFSLDMLADAISFDFSNSEEFIYKPSRRVDNAGAILKWLEGLVVVNPTHYRGPCIVLAHASVQDYVRSARFTKNFGPDLSESLSHTFIARTSIIFPTFSILSTLWDSMCLLGNGTEPHPTWLNGWSSPLEFCCREGYIEGVRGLLAAGADVNADNGEALRATSSTDIVRLLLENGADVNTTGVGDRSTLQVASSRGHKDIVCLLLEHGADLTATSRQYGSAVHAASLGGHTDIVRLLLEAGANVNTTGGPNGSALQAASGGGHTETMYFLLRKGADVNATGGRNGSALQAASRLGHINAVHLLLGYGANVNTLGGEDGSPLQAACKWGRTEIVGLLLEHGANVNATGRTHGSALQAASVEGHIEVVRLLLKHGADVNATGGEIGSALQAASRWGDIGTVSLLLEGGADVNATGGMYGSALRAASEGGLREFVQLLLEHGADVNATGGETGSALDAASAKGHIEVVRLLLEHGADVNAMGGTNGSALQAAARWVDTGIVSLLLEHGAKVNTTGGEDGSPLQAACTWGQTETVGLLLEHGANLTVTGGRYGDVLQAASAKGRIEVVRLLLEHGANVNAMGGEAGTALHAASANGHIEVVRLLLEHGGGVNARGGEIGSVLQAASSWGDIGIVSLLLDCGANVNATGGRDDSALQAASTTGRIEVVRLLLEHGADVNARGGRDDSALQAASAEGHIEVVRLLLEHSADVNATGGEIGSALQAASRWGDLGIVSLLLERGADVNATGGNYGSALQNTCELGYTDVVQLLLENGANANAPGAPGGEYGSALQAASAEGHTEIVCLLLANGADANTTGGPGYESVFQLASLENRTEIKELLLQHGAAPEPPPPSDSSASVSGLEDSTFEAGDIVQNV